jgi:hypothetical protein
MQVPRTSISPCTSIQNLLILKPPLAQPAASGTSMPCHWPLPLAPKRPAGLEGQGVRHDLPEAPHEVLPQDPHFTPEGIQGFYFFFLMFQFLPLVQIRRQA